MNALPTSAKLARKVLKIIFLPAVILVAVTRFTPFRWYWIDIACIALVAGMVALAVAGRVFMADTSGTNVKGDGG